MKQRTSPTERAVQDTQAEILCLVQRKLGRGLSEKERAGIERICSLMMLEAIHRSFSADTTTPETVEADLDYFATRKD